MSTKNSGILGGCIVLAGQIVALVPQVMPSSAESGRYQLVHGGGNVFVLDTKTGRYWQRYVSPNSGPTEWDEGRGPWITGGK